MRERNRLPVESLRTARRGNRQCRCAAPRPAAAEMQCDIRIAGELQRRFGGSEKHIAACIGKGIRLILTDNRQRVRAAGNQICSALQRLSVQQDRGADTVRIADPQPARRPRCVLHRQHEGIGAGHKFQNMPPVFIPAHSHTGGSVQCTPGLQHGRTARTGQVQRGGRVCRHRARVDQVSVLQSPAGLHSPVWGNKAAGRIRQTAAGGGLQHKVPVRRSRAVVRNAEQGTVYPLHDRAI